MDFDTRAVVLVAFHHIHAHSTNPATGATATTNAISTSQKGGRSCGTGAMEEATRGGTLANQSVIQALQSG